MQTYINVNKLNITVSAKIRFYCAVEVQFYYKNPEFTNITLKDCKNI